MEIGDKQAAVNFCPDRFADAIALVAHDDQSVGGELLGVDVLAVEEGAVNSGVRP